MARVRQFDPSEEGKDRVTEDGVSTHDPVLSHELAPMPSAPKVSMTQARAAANMRFAGAPYDKIAEFLQYKDPATARQVVEAHIAKAYPDETRESLFRLTSIRLEELYGLARDRMNPVVLAPVDGEMVEVQNDEQIAYMKVGLDILGRQMKLHGLEAPTRVEISPDLESFETVVQRMTASVRGDEAAEADVVEYTELEEIEPGEFA